VETKDIAFPIDNYKVIRGVNLVCGLNGNAADPVMVVP